MLDRSTAAAPPVDAVPGEPVASWIADDLADKLKGFNALLKAGKDTIPVMTVYTQLNSLRNRVQATLAASVASRAGSEPEKVYLIATGETHSGYETYTRHENSVPFADHEVLYTAPIAPAAAAEPSEPAQEAAEHDDGLLTGQAQYLIGALMGHGLLARSMPEDQYLKLWDVVKRQLRCVNREGARAASPNPQDSATPDRERAASLAASEDTKRLDWLEKGAEKSKSLGYQWDAFTFNFAKYSTIREALDAAMNNPKAPNA